MNRAELLAKAEPATKQISIAGLGELTIKKLTKSELCRFQQWRQPKGKLNDERDSQRDLKLIQMSVLDGGELMFADSELALLGDLPGKEMDELAYEVMLFNGYMTEVDVDLLGKLES